MSQYSFKKINSAHAGPPTSIVDCQKRRREFIEQEEANLPDYAYGYEEGERYAKLRFTDPIRRQADQLYARWLEQFTEWQTACLDALDVQTPAVQNDPPPYTPDDVSSNVKSQPLDKSLDNCDSF